ncbi:2OG-Fe(II) oxygenase family protein [Aurantiacibacter odishensis]|uniref:2OG-Fe(II) oxygenase family protein n=1 Tax=Aurantiacibacter odishensis TaxID=1155476 RepID=UPI001F0CC9E0|nr:tetratricopeptide repeat protein [Aurantiacibacter odishensis]
MNDILAEAARLAQGDNPQRAVPLLDGILSEEPANVTAITLRGLTAQRLGMFDLAVRYFADAHRIEPSNPARKVNLGMALKGARRFEDAVRMLREADAMRPGHPATLNNLGSCLIANDMAGEAVAILRTAITAKSGDPGVLNNLGIALARTGDSEGAIAAYTNAIELRPHYTEARLNLADLLRSTNRLAEAKDQARIVLQAQPGHPRASNLVGMILEDEGNAADAIRVWQQCLSQSGPNHPVGVNLMRLLIAQGRPAEAKPIARLLLETVPQSTSPLAYLAAALDQTGELEKLAELRGLDRFVRVIDLRAPAGFESLAQFNAQLCDELAKHPSLTFEPEGLVARKGRQSGELAEASSPALAAMKEQAITALRETWEHLGESKANHPFLAARPADWSITMWGTILQPGGAVEPHIHAPNWLSGVYYPDFADSLPNPDEGAFSIGVLPDALGTGLATRTIRPRAGRMILFPSFLWHGTLPFAGNRPRISIAFDLVPEGIGRPHRI